MLLSMAISDLKFLEIRMSTACTPTSRKVLMVSVWSAPSSGAIRTRKSTSAQAQRRQHRLVGHDAAIGPQAAVHGNGLIRKRVSRRCDSSQHQVLRAFYFPADEIFMRPRILDHRFHRGIGEEAGSAALNVCGGHDHADGRVAQLFVGNARAQKLDAIEVGEQAGAQWHSQETVAELAERVLQ